LCLKCKRFSVVKLLFYTYDSLISYSLKGKMKNHRLLISIGASVASFLSGLLPAVAVPDLRYNGADVYKDAKDNVYIIIDQQERLNYSGVDITKNQFSDACGFTSIKLNSGSSSFPVSITFNGTSDSLATIPTVTDKVPYKCTNGVVTWKGTAQTNVFQTSQNGNGSLTIRTIYYPSARTGGASKQGTIAYTANLSKMTKPNACGFILTPGYIDSRKKTSGTLSLGRDPALNIATLPINPSPPECVGGKAVVGSTTAVTTFNGASLYRTTKNIYFTGLVPRSLNVVGYDTLSSKTFSTTSTCGRFDLKYSVMPKSIKVVGTTYPTATAPSGVYFDCTNPRYIALAANQLYMMDGKNYLYKTSDLNLKKLVAETPIEVVKNIAVNACGFAVIPALNIANGFTAGDKVTINGSTPYDVMTLPLAPTAPTCKNGVTYLVSP
jgi:hypothetical protein